MSKVKTTRKKKINRMAQYTRYNVNRKKNLKKSVVKPKPQNITTRRSKSLQSKFQRKRRSLINRNNLINLDSSENYTFNDPRNIITRSTDASVCEIIDLDSLSSSEDDNINLETGDCNNVQRANILYSRINRQKYPYINSKSSTESYGLGNCVNIETHYRNNSCNLRNCPQSTKKKQSKRRNARLHRKSRFQQTQKELSHHNRFTSPHNAINNYCKPPSPSLRYKKARSAEAIRTSRLGNVVPTPLEPMVFQSNTGITNVQNNRDSTAEQAKANPYLYNTSTTCLHAPPKKLNVTSRSHTTRDELNRISLGAGSKHSVSPDMRVKSGANTDQMHSPSRHDDNVILLDTPCSNNTNHVPSQNLQKTVSDEEKSDEDDVILVEASPLTTGRKRMLQQTTKPALKKNKMDAVIVLDEDENFATPKKTTHKRKSKRLAKTLSKPDSTLQSGINLAPFLAPQTQPVPSAVNIAPSVTGSRYRFDTKLNPESGDYSVFRSRDNDIMEWLSNNDPVNTQRSVCSSLSKPVLDCENQGDFADMQRNCEFQPSMESVRNKFGTNLYNPNTVVRKGLRTIVIDGSNIALGHTNGRYFSVKGLKMCIDYFRAMGHTVRAFVPQFRLNSGESSDPSLLRDLGKEGVVIFTPSRVVQGRRIVPYDDRFIVQYAAACDGVIVSNDNFRDVMKENPTLRPTIEQRLLMFTWVDDMIIFPPDPLGPFGPSLDEFLRFP